MINPEVLHFNFLLDRSGSMSGSRIEKAREALILFLRSLPPGCMFSVVSFGTFHRFLTINGETVIENNEENV